MPDVRDRRVAPATTGSEISRIGTRRRQRRQLTIAAVGFILIPALAPAAPAVDVPGLLVRLYDLERSTAAIPELADGQLPNEVLVAATLDLGESEQPFGGLEDNFLTVVTGQLQVARAGMYAFRLRSDDGSKLWINGKLVIDNDGLHGDDPQDGELALSAGKHELRVLHFEAQGGQRLRLEWRAGTSPEAEFALIPADVLSHDSSASKQTEPGKKKIIPPLRRGLPGDGAPLAARHPAFERASDAPGPMAADLATQVREGLLCWFSDGQTGNCRADSIRLPGGEFDYVRRAGTAPYEGQLIVATKPENLRVAIDPDGAGGVAFRFGTQAVMLGGATGEIPFEMLNVRAMTNGFEIEFTKPLDPRIGWEPESYYVEQWPFAAEATHRRGPKRDGVRYAVKSASVSSDRCSVFLEIPDLKPSHVVYLRLLPPCLSEAGDKPLSTEAWYTLNQLPAGRAGDVRQPPATPPQNFLTDAEKKAGWRLLFDGKSTDGWLGWNKDSFPDAWQVKDGCLVLTGSGGDIMTVDEYDNFELQVDWRICAAGNSGIFYRAKSGPEYSWPWLTAPEMQVLDNAEHADGRSPLTSAGSNYALYAPTRDVTQPVGLFNRARIVVQGNHVEHWLNGEKIVAYELHSPEWTERVAGSKFARMPDYGKADRGHIVLQDHGDRVWYRNIRIRELDKNGNVKHE